MNRFEESILATVAAVFVVLLVFFIRAIRAALREEREKNTIDYQAEWRELCRRITDAVEHHATGRLVVMLSEFQPFGGDIVVKWVSNRDSRKVLGVYFPSEDHPPGRIRLVESRGRTRVLRSLSPRSFRAFIEHVEEVIGMYESPLSEGGDKSNKL